MRSILIVLIAQCLLLATAGVSSAQETQGSLEVARDATVAKGVRALSEDVRKLSDDVKELVALLKTQQKNPPTESNAPTTREPSQATTPIPDTGIKDDSIYHSVQSMAFEVSESPSKLDEHFLKSNSTDVRDQSVFLNAKFKDISLVEAKTIALKTLRESVWFSSPERDELDRFKDEQNLLKSVEDKYWDLWAAFRAYEACRQEYAATLDCWRVASNGRRFEAKTSESLIGLLKQRQLALHASLNGSENRHSSRGLRQFELLLRDALGLNVDGTMLRPTAMPNLNSPQLDWLEVNKTALKENVHLKGKRRELEASRKANPNGKLGQELAAHELRLTEELENCCRNVESSYASLEEYLECCKSNEQEITIYQTRLRDKVGDQNALLDHFARAHQRRAQAEIQYHQAASEYNKALANTKYLCSRLTVGSDSGTSDSFEESHARRGSQK